MFKRTRLSHCMLMAFSSGLMMTNVAAQTAPSETQRVEVTGSNIKRIDAETVSPVEVLTREQIERTGQPTVADVLRRLPSNSGSFGESFSNSFAPGAAGISLRGLGQKTTLVLINGRRVASYGFAQNLQDSFVDLNSIPSSAVERIEILKDGASAIYGSDAIAGVVNVILRKDFRGFEGSVTGGAFEGKNEYRAVLAGGMGDLSTDRFNVFAMADYYKRDYLSMADTKFGESRDFRSYSGGRNFTSLTGGGTWRQLTPAGGLSNTYRAISDCNGKVLTGPEAAAAGLINLTPPPGQSQAAYNTAVAQAAAGNTFCAKDFDSQFTGLPGTERIGLLVRGTLELSPSATAFAEVGFSRVDTFQTFQSAFFAGTTGLTPTDAGLRPFAYNINFAPGSAGNPFDSNARYVGVFNDMGTRDNDIRSDATRFMLGANYTVGKWDLESAVGMSQSKDTTKNLNRTTLAGTSAVFGVGTDTQPPVPTSTSSSYNLDRWTTNTDAVRNAMLIDFDRKSTSKLSFIDTKGSTTLGSLSGGEIGLALGIEHRRESLNDDPAELATNGGILGQGITATNGKRNNTSVFGELSLPFTKSIEAQLALRTDHYSDYGSSTTPKVGMKWKANDMLLLRANYGKGFRAPTLPEISPSVATFFTSVTDPQDDTVRQVSGVFAGNPNLKAEKSTSTTFGAVIEPTKDFSVAIDYYRIDWKNVVASPSFQDIIDASCTDANGDLLTPCPSTPSVVRDPATNQVVTILSNYENLSQRVTSGVDIDAKLKLASAIGRFTIRTGVNYVRSFKEDGVECAGTNGCSNTIPRIKGVVGLDFDRGPLKLTGQLNYTHHYRQDLLPASYFTAQNPEFQNGVYPEFAPSYTTLDLFGSYDFNKNLTASLGIINVLDKTPPYDPGFSSTSLYDFSLHDIRGRRVSVTLKYTL